MQPLRALRLVGAHIPRGTHKVIKPQAAKDAQHNDLQDDAGDNHAVTDLLQVGLFIARGSGNAAADGLDD
jgi:hypothetical protein